MKKSPHMRRITVFLVLGLACTWPSAGAGAEACTLATTAAWQHNPNLVDPDGDTAVPLVASDLWRAWLYGTAGSDRYIAGIQSAHTDLRVPGAFVRMFWDYPAGTTRWIAATGDATDTRFTYGHRTRGGAYVTDGRTQGVVLPGSSFTVLIDVPMTAMGDPAEGDVLAGLTAQSGLSLPGLDVISDDTDGTVSAPATEHCDPVVAVRSGGGTTPGPKRCYGSPPRQTVDPMSAPCVPYFDGENFGDTWQGVTGDEITILLYFDSGNYAGQGNPSGYVDLDAPEQPPCPKGPVTGPCDHVLVRASRALVRAMEAAYQTYDRHVHAYAFFSDADSAALRRADAVDNWTRLRPFAVLQQAGFKGHAAAYADAMAARGVMVFGSPTHQTAEYYSRNAPLAWSFWPDVAHWADLYASYVCTKVVPHPVAHSGNVLEIGRDRKVGLWYTSDPARPELGAFAAAVKARLAGCGVTAAPEATFSRSGFIIDGRDSGVDQADAVGKFQAAQVTTVLWLGGVESKFTHAAASAGWYPEIVLAGDLDLDANGTGRLQEQSVWSHAWGTQMQLRIDRTEDRPGYVIARQYDPALDADASLFAADLYPDHFMFYEAVQLSGPDLTPGHVDQGFHAKPAHASTNPYAAACYFDPGDHTCMKDDMEVWWDPSGVPSGTTQPGCMRMVSGGRRYQAGSWPAGDTAFAHADDPCTAYGGSLSIRVV